MIKIEQVALHSSNDRQESVCYSGLSGDAPLPNSFQVDIIPLLDERTERNVIMMIIHQNFVQTFIFFHFYFLFWFVNSATYFMKWSSRFDFSTRQNRQSSFFVKWSEVNLFMLRILRRNIIRPAKNDSYLLYCYRSMKQECCKVKVFHLWRWEVLNCIRRFLFDIIW